MPHTHLYAPMPPCTSVCFWGVSAYDMEMVGASIHPMLSARMLNAKLLEIACHISLCLYKIESFPIFLIVFCSFFPLQNKIIIGTSSGIYRSTREYCPNLNCQENYIQVGNNRELKWENVFILIVVFLYNSSNFIQL